MPRTKGDAQPDLFTLQLGPYVRERGPTIGLSAYHSVGEWVLTYGSRSYLNPQGVSAIVTHLEASTDQIRGAIEVCEALSDALPADSGGAMTGPAMVVSFISSRVRTPEPTIPRPRKVTARD